MFPTKSILETLAALGTGAILLTGCGGSQTPVNSTEVPAAEAKKTDPAADDKAAGPTETTSGEAAAGTTSQTPGGNDAASPTPAGSATPAASAKPAASTKPKTAKKPGTKKPGGEAACGEGTCG